MGCFVFFFFFGQILAELTLESIFTTFPNPPPGLAILASLFQYLGCIFVPIIVNTGNKACPISSPRLNKHKNSMIEGNGQDGLYIEQEDGNFEIDEEEMGLIGVKTTEKSTLTNRDEAYPLKEDDLPLSPKQRVLTGFLALNDGQSLFKRWAPFVLLSALVFVATTVANMSLAYVRYPVKVVFKSSKLIPTMVVSGLMGNSRGFKFLEYVAAGCLCIGAAGFVLYGSSEDDKKHHGSSSNDILGHYATLSNTAIGVILLLCSVFADSFVANMQQSLMQQGHSPESMMIKVNVIGIAFSLGCAVISGHVAEYISFLSAEPKLLGLLFSLAALLGVGIWCYTKLIEQVGSVSTVAVSTLRKVVTIILSYMWFPKPFDAQQGGSLMLVLTGMVLQVYSKTRGHKN